MQARRCQGCAAPLPDSAADEAVRCPFCGLLHDAKPSAAASVQVHRIDLRGAGGRARVPRWLMALVAIIVFATVVPMLAGVYIAWRASSVVIDTARTLSSTSTSAPAALTTAGLKDVTPGYHAVQVAPPAGGYGAVDPVAALPWSLAIAQAWRDDARLERIDIRRMRPEGTLNVADDAEAVLTYRFRSATAVKELREQARLRESAQAIVELWVRVTKGTPQVFASEQRGGNTDAGALPPPHPDALAAAQLLQRPSVQALRGDLPYLDGYLIHLGSEGWVWYFSSLAGESRPRVRARDGAVWPYRNSRS